MSTASVLPATESSTASSGSVKAGSRLNWLDVLRGLAVIGMVETHVVNTFLHDAYDDASWRGWLSFLNGLLAPMFLWIAGYVQGLSIRKTFSRPDKVPSLSLLSSKRLSRLLVIFSIGYFLHIPWHHWLAGKWDAESWRIFFQVDILQCLAVSLLLIVGVASVLRNTFDFGMVTLLAISVLAAPLASQWHSGVLPLDAYLNHSSSGSLFPLFPWLGFAAAGALMSRWSPSCLIWIPIAILLMLSGDWLAPNTFSSIHPAFFMERLGWLIVIATGVFYLARVFSPFWLRLAGRESLFVYVAHLLILHAIPVAGSTPDRLWGKSLDLVSVLLAFFALLVTCLALALIYRSVLTLSSQWLPLLQDRMTVFGKTGQTDK